MEELKSISVSGVGKITSGKYKNVSIDGAGKTVGDIECNKFSCNGAATLNGNIKAQKMEINGATSIKGNLDATKIVVNGSCKVVGSLESKGIMEVNGALKVTYNIKAENIKIDGAVSAKCIEAEDLKATGGLSCESVNAERFLMEIPKHSMKKMLSSNTIGEIVGNEITIVQSDVTSNNILSLFGIKINLGNKTLNIYDIDLIEGDEINLENVNCKTIRGKNITLGKNCNVENVEYINELILNEDAQVLNVTKVQ